MKKYLFIVLLVGVCFGQTEEWIYYNEGYGVYRTKPDNSQSELFMDSLMLRDISQDGSQILLEKHYGYGIVTLIYIKNFNAIDTLVLQDNIYWARLTQNENEIIYFKPHIGNQYKDQIYKYSFLDSSTTLIADSLYRFINMNEIMSPQKDKVAYFKPDLTLSQHYQLYVADIHSGQKTFLTNIQTNVSAYVPPNSFWAMDDYIYLNINDGNYSHLYKVHSSNTEIPINQLTNGDTSFSLLRSYGTDLDKLALTSWNDTDFKSDLWIYELETNQLSYIDTIQGEISYMQTWSNDNSKVAIGSALSFWGSISPIQIYDFVNDTITVLSDSTMPLFWLGGQELKISENFDVIPDEFVLHQNYPNPFNPTTSINYDLPANEFVSINVFDLMGREVKTLVNKNQVAGFRSVHWNATNNLGQPVSAGMYIYTIQAGEFRQTKKMVLLK